jgi:hypothetical protein
MLGDDSDIIERDGRLNVGDLVRMFEASEEATQTARLLSERDRDYLDGSQWTSEEIAKLEARGQPVVVDNRIKSKIDFLVGLEKQQRIDPRALPRTPQHEEDADAATQALRYVCDDQDFDNKRSMVWRNLLVEGAGGIRVHVEPSRATSGYGAGEMEIKIDFVAWDRMFWDPHAARSDFSDAGYLGLVIWMDYADALAMYPDGRDALETTMASASHTDTYDDKPKFTSWADKKRKRVRIVQMWIRRDEDWHFAEFTKGGILKAGPSPYRTDAGESDCELIFQSAFINRENERYGYVREMVSPQDEINKRRSKALHELNSRRIIAEKGAFDDIEKARREAARPDGMIERNKGYGAEFDDQRKMADFAGQLQLLQEAQNAIDLKGPNATMLGDKAQGSAAASGKAIIASQQGGMVSLGDLLDHLRWLDKRVFRAIWHRIRQFWTAEKWVRTTDDERNVKWVGINVDPARVQLAMQSNPAVAAKVAGVVRNVAELDCDIIIDEAPDNLTPQLEQFQALVELKKMDARGEIPFRAVVEAIPNLKNRRAFLEHMERAAQAPPPPPPELVKAQLDGQVKQQEAALDAQLAQAKLAADTEIARRKAQAEIELARTKTTAEIMLAREKAEADMLLKREAAAAAGAAR